MAKKPTNPNQPPTPNGNLGAAEAALPEEGEVVELLGQLRSVPPQLHSTAESVRRRERQEAAIEAGITKLWRRKRRQAMLTQGLMNGGVLAGAAAVLLMAWPLVRDAMAPSQESSSPNAPMLLLVDGEGTLERQGVTSTLSPSTLERGVTLGPSDELSLKGEGRARLRLANAAVLELSKGAQVKMNKASAAEEHIELARGRAQFDVPKLSPKSALRVTTPHARVKVIGTKFVVRVKNGGTCVRVSEGRVSVTGVAVAGSGQKTQTFVSAGGQWSTDGKACAVEPEATKEATNTTVKPEIVTVRKVKPMRTKVTPPSSPKKEERPQSSLAVANRLLEEAVAARRRGDRKTARRLLHRLLADHPHALTDAAKRELARVNAGK